MKKYSLTVAYKSSLGAMAIVTAKCTATVVDRRATKSGALFAVRLSPLRPAARQTDRQLAEALEAVPSCAIAALRETVSDHVLHQLVESFGAGNGWPQSGCRYTPLTGWETSMELC